MSPRCSILLLTLLLTLPAGLGQVAEAENRAAPNWPQWRGPSGQGYSQDTQVPLTWGDQHNLLWKTALPGQGNSSPIIWGNRIFLTASESRGNERHVLCVQASDGKLLWQRLASRGVAPGKTHAWNGYASASCTTDGTLVYAFFGTPGLFCYDHDGKLIWKHSFGLFTNDRNWGDAASPFLFEDLIIQNCDNAGPAGLSPGHRPEDAAPMELVALDKATGQVRWRTPRNQGIGFSTPLLLDGSQGRPELVLNGPYGVWAYDPRTGQELWHCERHKGNEQALFGEPMPAFTKDTLFAASGRPGPLQAIRRGTSGDVTRTHVRWEGNRKGSRDVASPLVVGEQLYCADKDGLLSCYDVHTGQMIYKDKRRLGAKVTASPVLVRDKILFLLENGETVVLEPGGTYREVGRNRLADGTEFRASPAIVDGRLYLRSQSHLYCIGPKQ